jgi:hypothetical protein
LTKLLESKDIIFVYRPWISSVDDDIDVFGGYSDKSYKSIGYHIIVPQISGRVPEAYGHGIHISYGSVTCIIKLTTNHSKLSNIPRNLTPCNIFNDEKGCSVVFKYINVFTLAPQVNSTVSVMCGEINLDYCKEYDVECSMHTVPIKKYSQPFLLLWCETSKLKELSEGSLRSGHVCALSDLIFQRSQHFQIARSKGKLLCIISRFRLLFLI